MRVIKETIHTIISEYVGRVYPDAGPWLLEVPKDETNGDFSTNIAFVLAKIAKKSPLVLAEEIVIELRTRVLLSFCSITSVKGFINFFVSDIALLNALKNVSPTYGSKIISQPKRILIEFVSANPTGPLHIGHGRWAALGDSLARCLEWVGHEVYREFFVNDAGAQIEKLRRSVDCAREGKAIPDDGYHGAYVLELAKLDEDPIDIILLEQKELLENFRVHFDVWFSEKSLHKDGRVSHGIELLKEKQLAFELDGALWFKSITSGDDKDRVLMKSNGDITYFAADIAYHIDKLERGFDTLINIWGADHHGYVQRLRGAIQSLYDFTDIDARFKVLLGQLVSLYRDGKEVRMSKRTGEMITLQEVIDEIGIDATRYFLIMKSADAALEFDLDLAKEHSAKNPVYYVQYAHARICSILSKTQLLPCCDASVTLNLHERALINKLLSFEHELLEIELSMEPFRLTRYIQELAHVFHTFYHDNRVISDDEKVSSQRLFYCERVKDILAISLGLVGVNAPERM